MKTITSILIILSLLTSHLTIASGNYVKSRYPFYIINAASQFDIDVNLMYAICLTESKCKARAINHNDGTQAEKDAGIVKKSYGMFQLQVETAKTLGFSDKELVTVTKKRGHRTVVITKTIDHTRDLLKPEINAYYAAKLIKNLYNKYHDTAKVISAYNAGHYCKSNKDYVLKVLTQYASLKIDKRF